ncbi:phospholipid-binding lipoprotein MlaA [Rhodobacter sp. JA431]|uniref:MlaA family lipoprotein n=1 Tax=Rhodobacter sp. JA431 TaxID=570013 RepID=UPI000BC9E9D1|nr:VacJ family lipoprotein [Rhodobacter sp. JA431]SOC07204.1 phospholipid-binding lipoprotein MlaA [Rhodobacter sp. JA431]
MRRFFGFALVVGLTLAGCGEHRPTVPQQDVIYDPYEAGNRQVHAFNKGLDRALFKAREGQPRSRDTLLTRSFSNAGGNLSLPGKVVNSLLQGRPEPAIKNTFRFVINSTLGIGGIFDPAGSSFSLPETDTDFGETLAVWGAQEGAYMELPFFGGSTERDALGRVVDIALDPVGQVLEGAEATGAMALTLGGKVAKRKRFGETVESVYYDSADSYAQERLLYLQMRRHQLAGEETNDEEAWDPYEDPYAE